MDEHNESDGMIRCCTAGWDEFKYPCCEKDEGDSSPCFKGSHIDDYGEGGHYWDDEGLEEKNKEDGCPVCNGEGEEEDKEEEEEDEDDDDDDEDRD